MKAVGRRRGVQGVVERGGSTEKRGRIRGYLAVSHAERADDGLPYGAFFQVCVEGEVRFGKFVFRELSRADTMPLDLVLE